MCEKEAKARTKGVDKSANTCLFFGNKKETGTASELDNWQFPMRTV